MTNPFSVFARDNIPEIDSVIRGFYDMKVRQAQWPFMKDMYADLAAYCLREGKRIRPLLLLLACDGYGKGRGARDEMIRIAASLEMMHSFLLIQDDIIDRAVMRRNEKAFHVVTGEKYGALTCNDRLGTDVALVLADVLFANALEIVASADICNRARKRFLGIFSGTYEMTAWGQVLDSLNTMPKKISITENIPLRISTLKTAYYTIYYPLLMGYVLSTPGGEREQDALREFALPLGLSFQIRDDILGVFGDEKETGKSTDSDLLEGKITLLIQYTLETLKGKARSDFMDLVLKTGKTKKDVKIMRTTIRESGSLEKTTMQQSRFLEEARGKLDGLTLNKKYRHILAGLIDMLSA